MIPPLLRLALGEPGLLAEHLDAYAALAQRDWRVWRSRMRRRLLLWSLVALGSLAAILFGGVALMLWAVTGSGHWLLYCVPVAPALLALFAGLAAWREREGEACASLSFQFHEDMRLFKEIL